MLRGTLCRYHENNNYNNNNALIYIVHILNSMCFTLDKSNNIKIYIYIYIKLIKRCF